MKLFNMGDVDTTPNTLTLSNEIIAVQPNDYIIPVINNIFQKIIDANEEYQPKNSKVMFGKKNFKNLYKELDRVIKERFGVNIIHISAVGMGYAVLTNPPKNTNILNREFEEQYEFIDDALKYDSTPDKHIKKPEDIADYDDVISIYTNWKKSIDVLDKQLNTSGIVIDLHKARITGLPKDYHIYLLSDPVVLINDGELTAEELTAVLMHEIGHLFTHLEYSYRTVENTSVLIDTMHENIVKKGKGFKESIKLTYKELGGEDDLSKTNAITATIKTLNKYNKNTMGIDESEHSFTDSEQLADQFAGRFGLSGVLASGLDKVMTKTGLQIFSYEFMSTALVFTSMIVIYGIIITGTILGGFSVLGFLALYTIIAMFITSIVSSIFTRGHSNDMNTYDDNKRRYQRMRNEVVRILRTTDMDKKLINNLLSDIANIDKLISKSKSESQNKSILDKMIIMLSSAAKTGINLKEMEQLIEDLQENDLHVSSHKLKTLV